MNTKKADKIRKNASRIIKAINTGGTYDVPHIFEKYVERKARRTAKNRIKNFTFGSVGMVKILEDRKENFEYKLNLLLANNWVMISDIQILNHNGTNISVDECGCSAGEYRYSYKIYSTTLRKIGEDSDFDLDHDYEMWL